MEVFLCKSEVKSVMSRFMESAIGVQEFRIPEPTNVTIARHSSPPAVNVMQLDRRHEMPLKSVNG